MDSSLCSSPSQTKTLPQVGAPTSPEAPEHEVSCHPHPGYTSPHQGTIGGSSLQTPEVRRQTSLRITGSARVDLAHTVIPPAHHQQGGCSACVTGGSDVTVLAGGHRPVDPHAAESRSPETVHSLSPNYPPPEVSCHLLKVTLPFSSFLLFLFPLSHPFIPFSMFCLTSGFLPCSQLASLSQPSSCLPQPPHPHPHPQKHGVLHLAGRCGVSEKSQPFRCMPTQGTDGTLK